VVTGKAFLGPMVYIQARMENGETCAAQAGNGAAGFQMGEAVHISWNAGDELRLPE
jgi:hypothetical protein